MNFSQFLRYQWNSWNCFSAFLLNFMWFAQNNLAQRFSIYHGLWSPSKDCQHLWPCSSIGFCNITAELFNKSLYSWSPREPIRCSRGVRGLRLRNSDLANKLPILLWITNFANHAKCVFFVIGVSCLLVCTCNQKDQDKTTWTSVTVPGASGM